MKVVELAELRQDFKRGVNPMYGHRNISLLFFSNTQKSANLNQSDHDPEGFEYLDSDQVVGRKK